MQLYFIRHAQSANNALWSGTGSDKGRSEDPELTDLGLQQAQALAEHLSSANPRGGSPCKGNGGTGFGLTHLYSSLMVRAVKTGVTIAARLDLELHGWQEIHERGGIYLNNGDSGEVQYLPGRDRQYFQKHYPALLLPPGFKESGWWDRKPLEAPEDSLVRARAFIRGLREKHGGSEDRVGIISHGGFYNDFLVELLGLRPNNGYWFSMFNTAITRIDFQDDWVDVVYQNRTDHLAPEMVT